MNWRTAQEVLNDALMELGLIQSELADPYASTNQAVVQARACLKAEGQSLLRDFNWQQLIKTHSFNTGNGTASYALPSDLARILPRTIWNAATDRPLIGPASPQQWEAMQNLATASVDQVFRILGELFYIHPTPSSTEAITYEYMRSQWVDVDGDGNEPEADTPEGPNDTLWFDGRLLICGVKLRLKRAKGFDVTAELDEYDRELSRAQGAVPAPVLYVGSAPETPRLLDSRNIPDTGFGS